MTGNPQKMTQPVAEWCHGDQADIPREMRASPNDVL